ncbi:MAG: signal peptidase II [Balneolaceae bacterium]|nr:signal peptidase II [Balneolaceae bacterium]
MSDKGKKLITLFSPIVLVLVIDQISKYLVRTSPDLQHMDIIEGWLAFNFTKNPGMALGMDWLSTPVISSIAILATIGILVYVLFNLGQATYAYLVCMGLILGGALGNIMDRIFMGIIGGYGGVLDGHVVDFIHFNLEIGETPVFPYIFNVADIAISTSIIILLLFHKKIMPVEDEADSSEENQEEKIYYRSEEEFIGVNPNEEKKIGGEPGSNSPSL